MYCRNCGKEVTNQAAVCLSCGLSPQGGHQFCQNCGAQTQQEAVVCIKCGCMLQNNQTSVSPAGPNSSDFSTKPGKIMTMAIVTLVSGCLNAVWAMTSAIYVFVVGLSTCGIGCLFIFVPAFLLLVAILEILYATKLLATHPKTDHPSVAIPILEILCLLTCNPVALAAGILNLIFSSDPEVKAYFAGKK